MSGTSVTWYSRFSFFDLACDQSVVAGNEVRHQTLLFWENQTLQIALKLLSGSKAGKKIVFKSDTCVLGRGDDTSLKLNSVHVSRRHCQLAIVNGHVEVRDLKSRNGTFVNEQPVVGKQTLRAGDVLRVGNFKFEFQPTGIVRSASVSKSAESPETSWQEFCKAVHEIEVPETTDDDHSTLPTVEMPAPDSPSKAAPQTDEKITSNRIPNAPQTDSRTAAKDAIRRYFSGR